MSKIPLLISNLRDLSIPAKHTSYIIPGVLYPAIEGKDINGDAIGTYTYGDVHVATGLKYYYTDIKGSKPIKDPRIGAHFGSQRHMFKSLQLLEQETATHGNIYNIFSENEYRQLPMLHRQSIFLVPYRSPLQKPVEHTFHSNRS